MELTETLFGMTSYDLNVKSPLGLIRIFWDLGKYWLGFWEFFIGMQRKYKTMRRAKRAGGILGAFVLNIQRKPKQNTTREARRDSLGV